MRITQVKKRFCNPSFALNEQGLKIIKFGVGHDAQHALLLADDGSVYFVGTAKRGEDGDQSKARRQLKSVKPKKFSRMEGLHVVFVRAFKLFCLICGG